MHGSHSIYMRILALESSCDESAVAVYDDAAGLLAHEIHSQIDLHRVYGGVVPELASRDHVRRLLPLVRTALADAKTTPGADRRRGLHRRPGADRRAADGRGARPVAGLRLEGAGHCRSSPRRPSAGAAARRRSAAVSAPGAAGVGRPHHAHRRGRARPLCGARRNARRRGGRSLRQVGQVVRPAVSRVGRSSRGWRSQGNADALRFPAAHAGSRRTRVQFLRSQDRGVAGGEGQRERRARSTTPRAPTSPRACSRPSSTRWSAKTLRALEQTGYDALVVAGGVGANRAAARTPGGGGCARRARESFTRASSFAPTMPP